MCSLKHVRTRLDRFTGFQDLNDVPSPSDPPHPSLSGVLPGTASLSESGFQFLTPTMGQSNKAWAFEPLRSRVGTKAAHDGEPGGRGGKPDERAMRLTHVEDVEHSRSSFSGEKGGRMNLCARGHWRPAEDAKLKQLVVQFGPQNWNLIAEHLEGRSGNSAKILLPGWKKFSGLIFISGLISG